MVQKTSITIDLFLLSMVGTNVVLNIQWLTMLGSVITNYSQQTMEFELQGMQVHWEGESWVDDNPLTNKELRCLVADSAPALLCRFELDDPSMAIATPSNVLSMTTKESTYKVWGWFCRANWFVSFAWPRPLYTSWSRSSAYFYLSIPISLFSKRGNWEVSRRHDPPRNHIAQNKIMIKVRFPILLFRWRKRMAFGNYLWARRQTKSWSRPVFQSQLLTNF